MEIRCTQKKEKLCICNFFIKLMATTHKKPQTETHSFKKEEKEERSMEKTTPVDLFVAWLPQTFNL